MTADAQTCAKKKRPPMHKLIAFDAGTVEEVFKSAVHLLIPESARQRKVFELLMPYLFVLRNKGCSWQQITTLLNQCGFKLQASTVKNYFSELRHVKIDLCQQKLSEYLCSVREVKKQAKDVDKPINVSRFSGIMEEQRAAAANKVELLFGGDISTRRHDQIGAGLAKLSESASPAPPQNIEQALPAQSKITRPASSVQTKSGAGLCPAPELQEELDSFAVLKPTTTNVSTLGNSSCDRDEEPTVPLIDSAKTSQLSQLSEKPSRHKQANMPPEAKKRCKPLQEGVQSLAKRVNIPSEVYQNGLLEHPAISGLVLTLPERLYGALLEYTDDDVEVHIESVQEKRFRVMWTKPVMPTPSTTSKNFTDIDMSFFKT